MTPASKGATRLPKRLKTRPPFEDWNLEAFKWCALIDASVHELKIAIVEALDWIDQPLSATEFWLLLGPGKYVYATVAYHARTLEEMGLTVELWRREARGATEVYYAAAGSAEDG